MATVGTSGSAAPRHVGVGVLGYGFMGRAHAFAYGRLAAVAPELGIAPDLIAVAGRTADKVAAAARRYGYASHYTDWHDLIADERVQVVDNCAHAYLHPEGSIAALAAGKHVLCEKPMAPTLAEARAMRAAAASHPELVAMCGFNYRFIPAVRLARQLISEGALGRIYHFRARYLQEGRLDPERPAFIGPEALGRAALPNLGSHVIDMSRFLVGEPVSVAANLTIHIPSRPHPERVGERVATTEADAFQCVLGFANGASGAIEASFVAAGRKNHFEWEINGEKGSVRFDLERLNELSVYLPERSHPLAAGFQDVLVTEQNHPLIAQWWPRGHILGWEHAFVHEIEHFLQCVVEKRPVGPEGATFADGYRVVLVADAIQRSAETGRRVDIPASE